MFATTIAVSDQNPFLGLSRQDDYTIVMFGHRKWREEVEFMGHCSTKWAVYLLSMRELVETGRGKPAPNDVTISNWH